MNCGRDSSVEFDISSVEKIFLKPEDILQDVEKFWKEETAFQLAKGWAPPGYPIHLEGFRDEIEVLAKLSPKEREQNEYLQFA